MMDARGSYDSDLKSLQAEATELLLAEARKEKQELRETLVLEFAAELRVGKASPSEKLQYQLDEYRDQVRVIDRRIDALSCLQESLKASARSVPDHQGRRAYQVPTASEAARFTG